MSDIVLVHKENKESMSARILDVGIHYILINE